ncbi:YlbG family protein [Salsuginibacillus kocurii]|uniref:YlbG family protein n=1 Tax=Salsuginibacillus kocurii TaxID=427078 RepID=UPI000A0343BA|nr:DUF2129 domain-containing protein [Salsuginibacillus kocurii]
MYKSRQGLSVWLRSTKKARQLRKYGNVHYVSKRMKYAILYCDAEEAEHVAADLESLPFVTQIDWSYRPQVQIETSNTIANLKAETEEQTSSH